ncbi:MAG: hypothetical protein HZB38_06360 [Planctomycetes bacterium]|nr:hypothetical protein [Planctomycetota bacterium]
MFALLEHTTADGVHWAFLLEAPSQPLLLTWRLTKNPLEHAGPIDAERIQDHRPIYLEFEGELTGGRGVVRRLDRGGAMLLEKVEDRLRVRLNGRRMRGLFQITTSAAGCATALEQCP